MMRKRLQQDVKQSGRCNRSETTMNHEIYNTHVDEHIERTSMDELPSGFKDLLTQFAESLPEDSTVLDVGSGTGRDIAYLKENYDNISEGIGIELASNMVKRSRKLNPEAEYILADATDIPLPDSSVDGVWCPATVFLLDFDDMVVALQEIARVLTEGGQAMVGFKLGDNQGREEGYHTRERWGEELTYYYLNADSTIELVGEVGLTVTDYKDLGFDGIRFRDLFLEN